MDTTPPSGTVHQTNTPDSEIPATTQQGSAAQAATSSSASSANPLESEDIFAALGASNIPDSDKAVLLLKMSAIVQTRVLDKIYKSLNPEQQNQLVTHMESESFEDMDRFLQTTVPHYEDMFLEEAKVLRRELVSRLAT